MTESEARSFPAFDPTRPVAVIGAGVMSAKVAWANLHMTNCLRTPDQFALKHAAMAVHDRADRSIDL